MLVVDLPTAFYLAGVELTTASSSASSTPTQGGDEFGLLLAEGLPADRARVTRRSTRCARTARSTTSPTSGWPTPRAHRSSSEPYPVSEVEARPAPLPSTGSAAPIARSSSAGQHARVRRRRLARAGAEPRAGPSCSRPFFDPEIGSRRPPARPARVLAQPPGARSCRPCCVAFFGSLLSRSPARCAARSSLPLRALAAGYTDLFRGMPLIIVLYLVGFGIPGLRFIDRVPS